MNTAAPVCTVPCNLCGGGDIEVLASRDRKGVPLQTVICRACGLVWTDPRPSLESTRTFYSEQYRQQYKAAIQPKLKHVYRDMNRAITRFSRIQPLLVSGMKLLDIGAGGGFFPYVVMKNGFAVTGLEPHAGYAQYAREEFDLDITTGFIQDAEYGKDGFDFITLNHVLEHLENPFLALTRIHSWLRPGGYLNVEVPNIEATYHAPGNKFHLAHLYTFNPENLQTLCAKAGYTVTDSQIVHGVQHINLILQKPVAPLPNAVAEAAWVIPGNYQRIKNIFTTHTAISHYLSITPYSRFVQKIAAYGVERIAVRRFNRGRDIADYLLEKQNS